MTNETSLRAHPITLKKAGKYDLCASCLRGVVAKNGEWQHVRRVAWTDAFR